MLPSEAGLRWSKEDQKVSEQKLLVDTAKVLVSPPWKALSRFPDPGCNPGPPSALLVVGGAVRDRDLLYTEEHLSRDAAQL